jgi:hypothetical protein
MKSFSLMILAVLFTAFSAYAQNTFPASGNTGIGTSSPTSGLTVQTEGSNVNDGSLFLVNGTNTGFGGFATIAGIKTAAGDGGQYNFLKIQNAGGTKFLINGSGNVGIGINAPTAKLHLFNQFDVNQPTALKMFYQGSWGNPTYASNFRFIDLSSTENGKVLQVNGTGIGIGYDPPAWSSADQLYVNGNVGIGTTDPKGYKLAVNGSVVANSITVKVYPWADYVFKKEYQLPSLANVKTYIDQNHHLPEIPSEAEIAKNGLNLGEMNKLLMKKVEELTLYLIEQNKRIEKLEAQIKNTHE